MERLLRGRRALALALSCLAVAAATASAQPAAAGPAEAAIARLEAALARDASLSPELKSALLDVVTALRAERADAAGTTPVAGPAAPPAASAPTSPTPPRDAASQSAAVRRIEPAGDFRYRHESTDPGAPAASTRHRERVRLRAGLHWRPSAELTLSGLLQTGERDEQKSPHATLGNGFRTLPVNLSVASATWQPARARGLRITGGKFASPLVTNPIYGEMVWDQDVRPEGGLASWSLGGRGRTGGSAGYYVVQERANAADAQALVGQAFTRAAIGAAEATLALGYYGFDREASRNPGTLLTLAPGNATLDADGDGRADRFASDFRLWHPIAALRLQAAGRPLVLAAEYVRNADAAGGRGDGFGVGAAWGSTRQRGDWQAYYHYMDVEADAVFALVSQDDLTRATDYRAHLAGLRLQLLDRTGVHAWALGARPHGGGSFDWRFRVDLNVSY